VADFSAIDFTLLAVCVEAAVSCVAEEATVCTPPEMSRNKWRSFSLMACMERPRSPTSSCRASVSEGTSLLTSPRLTTSRKAVPSASGRLMLRVIRIPKNTLMATASKESIPSIQCTRVTIRS
jgi:hypothetical protein